MRRTAILLGALLLGAGVLAGAGNARRETARLQLVAANPLTVVGTGFRPGERPYLSATAGAERQSVRVTATPTGTFRARFYRLTAGRCDAVRVIAVRRAGTTALKRLPPPACQSERSPGSSPG